MSQLGKGTTARIFLPPACQDAGGRRKSVHAGPMTGAETILLVEDEARVRKLIVDVLTSRGYRVLEATRGEEALRVSHSTTTPST